MKYVIQCPFCNQRYELDEFREGAEAECEKCGNAFTITMNILNMSGKTTEPVKTLSPQIPKQNKTTQPISPKTHYKMDDENASVSFLHKINKHFNHMILSIIVALLFCIFWILLAVATEKTYYEYDVRSFYPKHDIMTGEGKRVYGTDIEEEKHLFSAQEELVATIPIITETV